MPHYSRGPVRGFRATVSPCEVANGTWTLGTCNLWIFPEGDAGRADDSDACLSIRRSNPRPAFKSSYVHRQRQIRAQCHTAGDALPGDTPHHPQRAETLKNQVQAYFDVLAALSKPPMRGEAWPIHGRGAPALRPGMRSGRPYWGEGDPMSFVAPVLDLTVFP